MNKKNILVKTLLSILLLTSTVSPVNAYSNQNALSTQKVSYASNGIIYTARQKVWNILSKNISYQGQVKNYCTYVSSVNLLNRKQYMKEKKGTFNLARIKEQNPPYYFTRTYVSTTNKNYKQSSTRIPKNEDDLRKLLDENLAGVILYSNYCAGAGVHAILVTSYTIDKNGKIQFYCSDPVVNKGKPTTKLEDASTFKYCNNRKGTGATFKIFFKKIKVAII